MRSVEIDGSTILFLPVVKGLVSEGEAVEKAINDENPDVIAISVSKEELAALGNKEDYDKYEPSDIEEIYSVLLESFGDVKIPPPGYVRARDVGTEMAIALIPIDMNEELYTETYCREVGGTDLIRESMFVKRAQRKRFDLSSAGAFAVDWDKKVNKPGGFRKLNAEREEHMAEALGKLAGKYRKIMAVIEYERAENVEKLLTSKSAQHS
ncbi:MAG TPA: hypothetical protein VGK23_11235 [Methanomassiliicoccales archaeon]|jgi:hypothetical protein